MEKKYSLSICIPIYRGSDLVKNVLQNMLSQRGIEEMDLEIIIGEDTPPTVIDEINKTKEIIESFNDKRIVYIKNETNLGYARNLKKITSKAKKDILFLLGQDDVLLDDAILKTYKAFLEDEDVGVVTRPYYWFIDDIRKPIRKVEPYDKNETKFVSLNDKFQFMKIFESVGQFSGLAYKREFLNVDFNEECFPAHIYPFIGILKYHKGVFLKDYTVAVGTYTSQTRSVSSIYDLSPTLSWLKMYDTLFSDDEFKKQKEWGYEHILANNYVGLIQLKNYAKKGVLEKEIAILIKHRPQNMLNIKFWFFAIGTLLVPQKLLRKIVDMYKENHIL